MLCVDFVTFTVAGGTLAATGTVYSADPCNDIDKVVMTSSEVALMRSQMIPSAFNLDLESAQLIALAVLGIWAIGFGFRALIQVLKTTDHPDESNH